MRTKRHNPYQINEGCRRHGTSALTPKLRSYRLHFRDNHRGSDGARGLPRGCSARADGTRSRASGRPAFWPSSVTGGCVPGWLWTSACLPLSPGLGFLSAPNASLSRSASRRLRGKPHKPMDEGCHPLLPEASGQEEERTRDSGRTVTDGESHS